MMMFRVMTVFFVALCLASIPARAEPVVSDPMQLRMNPPIIEPANPDGSRCFNVYNNAPYSVTGSFNTNFYEVADGTKARQRLTFRLGAQESKRYCTYGPFYPGERLEVVIRTLVPVFSCYTVAQGDIVIMGESKPGGGNRTWVDCR